MARNLITEKQNFTGQKLQLNIPFLPPLFLGGQREGAYSWW